VRDGGCGGAVSAAVVRAVWGVNHDPGYFTRPFYDAANFHASSIFAGTSVAVLTYIGFDAVSTFSEEVENPRATSCWPRCWSV